MNNKAKSDLLTLFNHALKACCGQTLVNKALKNSGFKGSLCAIGKAAVAMAKGAYDALGDDLTAGLVISKYREECPFPLITSSHPYLSEKSLHAGARLLEFIANRPHNEPMLFLISGGTSSLIEVLKPTVSLKKVQQLNKTWLSSKLNILKINEKRAQYSKIKQGGLYQFLGERPLWQLLISDIPSDETRFIGSGLLYPLKSRVKTQVLATNHDALVAASDKALSLGYDVYCHPSPINCPLDEAIETILGTVDKNTLCLFGGEVTLSLPKNLAKGGRNQHLALTMAKHLAKQNRGVFLSVGTDGDDGTTDCAGALVDANTILRGTQSGFDVDDALNRADSYHFLEAAGCLIYTGPTSTNVMDCYFMLA
jgi:glycerate 2-kinase